MTRLILCCSLPCVLLANLAGCNKKSDAPAPGAAAAVANAPAPAPAATVDDVVGKWKAVKVEGAPFEGLEKMILSIKTDIFPDHTYRSFNSAVGRVHGTWALDGNALLLTPAGGRPDSVKTYSVEAPRLVTHDSSLTVTYERQGPATNDSSPKYHMTASEFQAEVKKDPDAAQKKYDGVLIELTGNVTAIRCLALGPDFLINGPPAPGQDPGALFLGIPCSPLEPEFWATIAKPQAVKIVGIATIIGTGMSFTEVKVTLDGPSVLMTTTAEELAAEYAKDADATKKKYAVGYDGRSVIITGTVLEKQIKQGTSSIVYLGKGDARVECDYINDGWEVPKTQLAAVRVGQTIKFVGEYAAQSSAKTARLFDCKIITK